MRVHSPDELDLMAEAYDRALELAPWNISTTSAALRLVDEIAAAITRGLHDVEALARAALERAAAGGGQI